MPNPFQLTKLTQVHLQRLQSLGCHGQGAFQRTFLHVLHGTGLHGRGLVYQNFDFMYGYVPNRCPFLPLKWPFWHQKRAPHFELEINEYVVTFGLPLKLGPKLLGLGISATKKWQIYGLNYHELRFPFPSNSIPPKPNTQPISFPKICRIARVLPNPFGYCSLCRNFGPPDLKGRQAWVNECWNSFGTRMKGI